MTVYPDLHLDFKQALTQLLLAGKVVAVLLHTAIAVRVLQGNWDEVFGICRFCVSCQMFPEGLNFCIPHGGASSICGTQQQLP